MMRISEIRSTMLAVVRSVCWHAVVVILVADLCESEVAAQDSDDLPRRIAASHLPNPVQVHATVISGGLPEGDEAFKELAALGIKTVISVDGMKPDLVTARKYGLRYVHLPHGYDGVPKSRVKELAKAYKPCTVRFTFIVITANIEVRRRS